MLAPIHRFCLDRIYARDGHPGLSRCLEELEGNQRLSLADLAEKQLGLLRRILVHARDHTRFYRERFADCGFVPEHMTSLADLQRIPPLTKFDILERVEDLTDERLTPDQWHASASGGTTGHVLIFRRDNACLAMKEASAQRFERMVGWDHGQWIGLVWPAILDHPTIPTWKSRLRNWLGPRHRLLPVVGDRADHVREFMIDLTRKRATILRVFPNAAVPVAERVRDEGLPRPPLKAILSMGEVLQPGAKDLFEDVFQCPVIDSYRSRETGPVAQQCLHQQGMHIASDMLVVEADTARTIDGGAGGRDVAPLLVTDLRNYGMPFIRYEVSDVGALDPEPCPCGNPLPLLRNLSGRIMDVLYTTDGRPIHSINLIPNFILACAVRNQFQIVQTALTRITLRLGPPELPREKIAELEAQAKLVFGDDVVLTTELVDEIPLEASGKYRLMVCNVAEEARA